MKALFGKLLGRTHKTSLAPKDSRPASDSPATIEDGSDNAMRRQLVLVLLRDMIRRHGIPPQWIELQMLVVSSTTRGNGLYVRLVLKQWDARLMQYAQAFQNELLADIKRFEPLANQWLHGISWQLEMGASCPHTTLPDKSFWITPATADKPAEPLAPSPEPASVAPTVAASVAPSVPAFKPAAVARPAHTRALTFAAPEESSPLLQSSSQDNDDAMQDLERLFLIRDQEINQAQAASGRAPVVYEKTQPSPLR